MNHLLRITQSYEKVCSSVCIDLFVISGSGPGEVWRRFNNFTLDNYKWPAGAGLRFNLNKEDPTNIRIDYGVGKRTSGFYQQFGEALGYYEA